MNVALCPIRIKAYPMRTPSTKKNTQETEIDTDAPLPLTRFRCHLTSNTFALRYAATLPFAPDLETHSNSNSLRPGTNVY